MSKVAEKIAFLKGLSEGMGLMPDTPERKLLLMMLELLGDLEEDITALSQRQDDLVAYVDDVEADLGRIEDAMMDEDDEDDEDDDDCDCCEDHMDLEEDGIDFIEYECPHCGAGVYYDQEGFDLDEGHLCPDCGKELFPAK